MLRDLVLGRRLFSGPFVSPAPSLFVTQIDYYFSLPVAIIVIFYDVLPLFLQLSPFSRDDTA